jgi:hypothetical protein
MATLTPGAVSARVGYPRFLRVAFRAFCLHPPDARGPRFTLRYLGSAGPFVTTPAVTGFAHSLAGSPWHLAVSSSLAYRRHVRFPLLSTSIRMDAVTFSFHAE